MSKRARKPATLAQRGLTSRIYFVTASVSFRPIADIRPVGHSERMQSNRKVWIAIYVAAAIIFFGGYFGRVLETPYGFPFVIFCMLFGLAVNIYWWRTHRIERKD